MIETIKYTVTVPLPILGTFRRKLKMLARRCVQVGVPDPVVTEGEITTEQIGGSDCPGFERPKVVVQCQRFEISVQTPNLPGGWRFLGVVERADDLDGNLIYSQEDFETESGEWAPHPWMETYRHCDMRCEHCGTKRRRKKIVVLKDKAGKLTQVGATCLSKYIAGVSTAYAAGIYDIYCWYERMVRDLDREMDPDAWADCGQMGSVGFETLHVLAAAAEMIAEHGWTSARACGFDETPTRDRISEYLAAWSAGKAEPPSQKSFQAAKDALGWIRAKDLALLHGYMGNLALVLSGDALQQKRFGLAVSVFAAKQNEDKHAAEQQQKEQEEKQSPSEWVGDIKTRQTMTLTLDFLFDIHGVYGLTTMHKFHDEGGNVIIWFCTGYSEFEIDETYLVKATIKKHDVHDGIKQTIVNRVSEVVVVA